MNWTRPLLGMVLLAAASTCGCCLARTTEPNPAPPLAQPKFNHVLAIEVSAPPDDGRTSRGFRDDERKGYAPLVSDRFEKTVRDVLDQGRAFKRVYCVTSGSRNFHDTLVSQEMFDQSVREQSNLLVYCDVSEFDYEYLGRNPYYGITLLFGIPTLGLATFVTHYVVPSYSYAVTLVADVSIYQIDSKRRIAHRQFQFSRGTSRNDREEVSESGERRAKGDWSGPFVEPATRFICPHSRGGTFRGLQPPTQVAAQRFAEELRSWIESDPGLGRDIEEVPPIGDRFPAAKEVAAALLRMLPFSEHKVEPDEPVGVLFEGYEWAPGGSNALCKAFGARVLDRLAARASEHKDVHIFFYTAEQRTAMINEIAHNGKAYVSGFGKVTQFPATCYSISGKIQVLETSYSVSTKITRLTGDTADKSAVHTMDMYRPSNFRVLEETW